MTHSRRSGGADGQREGLSPESLSLCLKYKQEREI